MQVHLCTISFRHHLLSLQQLAPWAQQQGFAGIELWGIHARHLYESSPQLQGGWLSQYQLRVPMLSDYLDLNAPAAQLEAQALALAKLARHWQAPKVRTFAGNKGSAEVSEAERQRWTQRLAEVAQMMAEQGLLLLVETHPHTLADSGEATLRLLEEVNHPALRINFDTLHVWEGGGDPLLWYQRLAPWVAHFHLKNISAAQYLSVFSPANVYAAAGSRQGMVPLFEGVVDYRHFLAPLLGDGRVEVSLEWFGPQVQQVLAEDLRQLQALQAPVRRQSA